MVRHPKKRRRRALAIQHPPSGWPTRAESIAAVLEACDGTEGEVYPNKTWTVVERRLYGSRLMSYYTGPVPEAWLNEQGCPWRVLGQIVANTKDECREIAVERGWTTSVLAKRRWLKK